MGVMALARPLKRDTCYTYYNGSYDCNSAWYNWIRWVVLAVVIVAALLIFFSLSFFSARRRRRLGRQPFYGTGWAAYNYNPPTYQQSQQQPYYTPHGPQAGYNPAPPYSTQTAPQGGYYGQQQREVELQQPQPAYGGAGPANGSYVPPAGPPPGKA